MHGRKILYDKMIFGNSLGSLSISDEYGNNALSIGQVLKLIQQRFSVSIFNVRGLFFSTSDGL